MTRSLKGVCVKVRLSRFYEDWRAAQLGEGLDSGGGKQIGWSIETDLTL